MQATTTPKLADHRSAAQAVLAVIFLAVALVVGGTIGIAIQQASAPAAPAAAVGDYEASGVRRGINPGAEDRGLDGAAFRNPTNALTSDDFLGATGFRRDGAALPGTIPVVRTPNVDGYILWSLGTQPGTKGSVADDQMSKFNGYGLSKPGADETAKVGRAHR